MSNKLPLDGITILDLTRLLPGPYATQLLADMGADVVKIEAPGTGDWMRDYEPRLADGMSHLFATLNRNKKSLVLNLKDERGQARFLDLAAKADAVIEGFRPGVVDRLGVDYETVRQRNEAIVYCSLTGYGQTGPLVDAVGHDINYIGVSGLLGMTGESGEPPTVPGIPVGDYTGGFMAALSVVSGIFRARATGEGEYFDVSMTDVLVSMMSYYAPHCFHDDVPTPKRGETIEVGKYPCYDVYETADDEFLAVGAMEFKFWDALCRALDLPDLATRENHLPEGDRREEVRETVAATFRDRTADEWADRLDRAEVPWSRVNDVEEVWDDPHVQARNLVTTLPDEDTEVVNFPVQTDGDYDWIRQAPPAQGEHTREILAAAGLSGDEIDALLADGVVEES